MRQKRFKQFCRIVTIYKKTLLSLRDKNKEGTDAQP